MSRAVRHPRLGIEDLAGPYGVVGKPRSVDTRGWLPPGVYVYLSSFHDVGWLRGVSVLPGIDGAGRSFGDPALARRIAICEALERYASVYVQPVEIIVATARELGHRGLPLEDVARCSSAEIRRPHFPLVPPDPDARIRWTEGVELTSREPRLLPLIMTRMIPPASRSENFWKPMSTGCALHRNQVRALLGGLYEVVERDAVSVAWLRRLALPRLDPAAVAPEVDGIISWYRDRDVVVHLFDATTDIPIPSVLCVVESPHDAGMSQYIGSATGFDVHATTLKAVLEVTVLYGALVQRTKTLRRYRDVAEPIEMAAYMARASRRKAFSFLLDGIEERPLSRPAGRAFSSAEDELAHVLRLFRERGMAVYATDLTPREVEAIGYSVVQVLVPALQPASLHPLVQYRGHARLQHDHPAATSAQRRRDLNQWPLPMS
jgi:ribosomal protein S12 methylthiotransferase accessory factor